MIGSSDLRRMIKWQIHRNKTPSFPHGFSGNPVCQSKRVVLLKALDTRLRGYDGVLLKLCVEFQFQIDCQQLVLDEHSCGFSLFSRCFHTAHGADIGFALFDTLNIISTHRAFRPDLHAVAKLKESAQIQIRCCKLRSHQIGFTG